jgi:hypothetical protein
MKKWWLLLIFLVIPILPLASSKIIFNHQPDSVYNLGDTLSASFYIEDSDEGYVEAYLDCGEDTLFFKKYVILSGRSEDFNVSAKLDYKGNCKVKAIFKDEEGNTDEFEVTDKIDLKFTINNKNYSPLEKIRLNGTAIKANGQMAKGTATITIPSLTEQTVDISEGQFFFEYEIPMRTPIKSFVIKVKVSEKTGSATNRGEQSSSFIVLPKATYIEIISEDMVKPPVDYKIKFSLLDQEFKYFGNETIIYKVYDPDNELFYSGSVYSGEEDIVSLPGNALRNGWIINAYFGSLITTKQFFVDENKKILIEVEGGSNEILVTNIGNTYYDGVVNIFFENDLSSQKIPLNINLSVGEKKVYPLDIKGTYTLSVQDSESSGVELKGSYSLVEDEPSTGFITGAVVGSSNKKNIFPFVLGFLIVICVFSFTLYSTNKIRKKRKLPVSIPIKIADKEKNLLSQKNIYTVFFNIPEESYIKAERIIAKKYKLHRVNKNISFIMFYASKSDHVEISLVNIVRILKKQIPSISSIIHCRRFENKATSMQSAFFTKQLITIVKGNFITGEVYQSIREYRNIQLPEAKTFNLKEKIIKLYEIVN